MRIVWEAIILPYHQEILKSHHLCSAASYASSKKVITKAIGGAMRILVLRK